MRDIRKQRVLFWKATRVPVWPLDDDNEWLRVGTTEESSTPA